MTGHGRIILTLITTVCAIAFIPDAASAQYQ